MSAGKHLCRARANPIIESRPHLLFCTCVRRYASILSAVGLFMADVVSDLQEPCACKLEHSEFGTLADKLTRLFDRSAITYIVDISANLQSLKLTA